jgi:RNA 2',3'-cyclic 3'-phosphodiesterase
MRLFVALAPSAGAVADLDAACAPLRASRGDLRWTGTRAWHVTLAFLGEVSEISLDRLRPRLERGARRHEAFSLSFSGAGAFPAPGRANVLWSGLSGDRCALAGLAATVGAGARRAGAPPPDEGRRYQPHLTLARCRAPVNVEDAVAGLATYSGPAWRAEEIYLIRSHPHGDPRFEAIGSYRLGPLARPRASSPHGCPPCH